MTKPTGAICNLDCKYCFYLEKENLYPGTRHWAMSREVLEQYIRQYIAAQPQDEVHFAWQGGEPTLLGVAFFRTVVELEQQYANDKVIHNALQTMNGENSLPGTTSWWAFPSTGRGNCTTSIAWTRATLQPSTA
jgi:sulfatase maturation enzyme AslB (radical SAM superfamily)